MTRRFTHALAALYALIACVLLRCAVISYQQEALHYAVFFTAAAIALGTAIVHHSYLRDELRYAHARLDAATRPSHDYATAQDETVQLALASWCCDPAVITAGADHDPEHCTRKDSTT